jgi:hypothetical protein
MGGVKGGRHQLGQHCSGGGGQFGGFHQGTVTGGDRPDQGGQDQLEGVVPGADNQHHPLGLGLDPGFPWSLVKGQGHRLGPYPSRQVLDDIVQLANRAHLKVALKLWSA